MTVLPVDRLVDWGQFLPCLQVLTNVSNVFLLETTPQLVFIIRRKDERARDPSYYCISKSSSLCKSHNPATRCSENSLHLTAPLSRGSCDPGHRVVVAADHLVLDVPHFVAQRRFILLMPAHTIGITLSLPQL